MEKVVVQSASNLEFDAGDFERSYGPTDTIPDEARRGFDVDRINRPDVTYEPSDELPVCISNHVIVRWKDEFVWSANNQHTLSQFADVNTAAGCTVVDEETNSDHDLTQVLEFDPVSYSVLNQLMFYQANEMVDYVQPDYTYEPQDVVPKYPNDPIYSGYQWSLPKIQAPYAWSLTTGSQSVIVAVADTGADVNHPDFVHNLWSGQNNGDIHNFVGHNTNVFSYDSHGSNVASIIGAQGDNGQYMTGLSWIVSLMHLKVLTDNGDLPSGGSSMSVIDAINYAAAHAASAINLSLGEMFCKKGHNEGNTFVCDDYGLDDCLSDALKAARTSNNGVGMVAVCAAGNTQINLDSTAEPLSPGGIPLDNIISVAASDQTDGKAVFDGTPGHSGTNFGAISVDLAAPGKDIYGLTATHNGIDDYSMDSGTSQAAPHVTGTIALVKARYGWENYYGLRDRVLMGTDDVAAFTGSVRTGGRLNAYKALQPRTLIRNLSTRARVENGSRVMIGGFKIGGNGMGTLKVVIRAIGPSLAPFLTVPYLADPKITLYKSNGMVIRQVLGSVRGTDIPAAEWDELHADGFLPGSTKEPAMIMTLGPGAYTAVVESQPSTTGWGVGLFEIYELENGANEKTRLLNVSTRCLVRGTGEEQAIGGVMLGFPTHSNDTTIPKRSVVMFGRGPSLNTVPGRLTMTHLDLLNSDNIVMSSNEFGQRVLASVVKAADTSWNNVDAPIDELPSLGLTYDPHDSVLWPILKSGTYTAVLRSVNGSTGIGSIEMYEN